MPGFNRFKRSIRCHLKHGRRCPHIERHTRHRPREKKKADDIVTVPTMPAQLPPMPEGMEMPGLGRRANS